jgi:hypothetical protein
MTRRYHQVVRDRRLVAIVGMLVALAIAIWWWHRDDEPQRTRDTVAATIHRMSRAAAEAPASVSGRVTRAGDGAPLAGAIVTISRPSSGVIDTPAIVATTDTDGRWAATDVAPGMYGVSATARGFVPATRENVAVSLGGSGAIDLVLDAGGFAVTGTVKSADGKPVTGARVICYRFGTGKPSFALVATTAADGTYRHDLADGEYQLETTHNDFTRQWENVHIAGAPKTVDFVLLPGATVRGQVVSRDTNDPVPDATVMAFGPRGYSTARSDREGRFALHHLGGGASWIQVYGREYATTEPTMVMLSIGEHLVDVPVVADRAYTISGRVVDKGTRSGIAGARIMTDVQNPRLPENTTSADGSFEVVGVPTGSRRVMASIGARSGYRDVEIEGDVAGVEIEILARATLSGHVDPAGVAEINLAFGDDVAEKQFAEGIELRLVTATSDASGRFTLRDAPSGQFSIVAVSNQGLGGTLAVTVTSADQTELLVPLSPRASIAGRVVDAKGKPVANTYVHAWPEDTPMWSVKMSTKAYTPVAADGTFKLVGLETGTYDLALLGDRASRGRVSVTVRARTEVTGVTLTVEAFDAEIRGQVIGLDGKPAVGAWVTAARDEQMAAMMSRDGVPTDGDGRFVLGKLAKGKYSVHAEGSRDSSYGSRADVETGSAVTIVLAPLGSLTVQVTDDGKPVTEYDVGCQGPTHIGGRVTSSDGSHTFERVPPGEYECEVYGPGNRSGNVTVSPGATATLVLAKPAERWASLTGTVVSAITGNPIVGITVSAGDAHMQTDAAGRFVLDHAPASGDVWFRPREMTYRGMEIRHYNSKPDERLDLGMIKIAPHRTGVAGTYGFGVEVAGGKLVIRSVLPDGPAEAAGVQVGDEITTIEGHAVGELGVETARRFVMSGNVSVGQTTTIGVARGVSITVTAVKW